MSTESFYPNIGSLVTIEDFPPALRFLQNGLQNALDNIYYKNLQFVKSNNGSQGFYDLTLVTNEPIQLDLLNSGFSLVLNPGSSGETLIPITLNFNWPIIAFIKNFNLQEFSFSPTQMQNILDQLLSFGDTNWIQIAVKTFEFNTDLEAYQVFVDKINQYYNLTGANQVSYPAESDALQMAESLRQVIDDNTSITDSISKIIKEVYISSANDNAFLKNLSALSFNINGESILDFIKKTIIPQIDASLELSLGLAFPRSVLTPLNAPAGDPLPEPAQSIVEVGIGSVNFSTQGGFGFDENRSASLNHPSQIGNTGLGIHFSNLKLDLSRNTNISEADLDGRTKDFMGVYAEKASITLPSKWFNQVDDTTLQIAGYNILVGTGGISGTIALEAVNDTPMTDDDYLDVKIGNWALGFNKFDIEFKQNAIVESNLKGRLKIPKLKDGDGKDAEIQVTGHLQENGDFTLTASEPQGIPLNLFDFLTINFLTLELGKEDGKFFLGTSCEIWFENDVMNKIIGDQKIILPNLRIYEDGSLEIAGGNAFIPTNITLNLGPVEVAVTGIHFGSHQQEYNGVMRKYNYWGFDGAISLDPLGIDARGEGIKYYYTNDNEEHLDPDGNPTGDSFLRIQTIEVDLVIPGDAKPDAATAIIHGMLSIPEPGASPEYLGEVSVKLPQSGIAGGAAMRLQPRHPAFLLDAYVDLPAPIPVGPLGIYGFRGLLGFRYVAEKEAVGLVPGEDTWYDYYTHPPRGIHATKFSGPEKTADYSFPFSIGAGAVLGTSFDSGISISVRTMMLLSLPSLFLIEGRASLLSARLGLTDEREPPFFAFIAWGDRSIEMGMGADFKLPQNNGEILELYAEAQAAFFFDNPSHWYINLGTQENPNTAKVLSLFNAQSYLMISAQGIQAGSRTELDLNQRFGPAKVRLYAYIELGGFISFERFQLGGYIKLGGMIDVDIWIIGVSLELNTILSAEAAEPFLLYAELQVKACVKIIFKKVCKSFKIKLKWEKNGSLPRTPIAPLPHSNDDGQTDRTQELVKGVHMLTNEAFALDYLGLDLAAEPSITDITKVIPLDTYIDIKTVKGLIPGAVSDKIGGHTGGAAGYTDLIPPQKVMAGRALRQEKHKYSIEAIGIKAWDGNQWVNYHPFEALVEDTERANVRDLKIGYWQRSEEQYNAIRLLATTPFSFTEASEPGWFIPEQLGITTSSIFCESPAAGDGCSNVLDQDQGITYEVPTPYTSHYINGAYFSLEKSPLTDGVTVKQPYVLPSRFKTVGLYVGTSYNRGIGFHPNDQLVIVLPGPSIRASLKILTWFWFDSEEAPEQFNPYDWRANVIYHHADGTTHTQVVHADSEVFSLYQEINLEYQTTPNAAITKIVIQHNPAFASSFMETFFQEVCWLSLEDYEYNQTIPGQDAVEAEQQALREGAEKTIQPIWRPNTHYYIHFALKDEVDNGAKAQTFDYYYGFKTAGPVGHFHNAPGVTYGNEYTSDGSIENRKNGQLKNADKYPLTSLRQYIDYNRSYPNADGSLLQAKPLFYANGQCNINIYFSRPLAYHMLSGWPAYGDLPSIVGELNMAIKDPVSNVIIPYPLPVNYQEETVPTPTPQEGNEVWQNDQDPRIPLSLQALNQMIDHINDNNDLIQCQLTLGAPIKPASKAYAVNLTNLKPRKLYTALLYNAFDQDDSRSLEAAENTLVHQFVFQTSRYAHFEEQVKSYILQELDQDGQVVDSRQAVFDLKVPLDASAIDTAFALVNGDSTAGGNDLTTQYPQVFERVIEGVLGLPTIDPAQTTEFNLIKDSNTGDIIAILIRNSEPFNIPKIPIEDMKRLYHSDGSIEQEGAIEVMVNATTVDENYQVLYSKDYAQALVMYNDAHNHKKITATSLNFQFLYKTWDGAAYVANKQDPFKTIYVENIQLN